MKMTEVQTMPCSHCGARSVLNVPEEAFYAWMYGEKTIEEAFPDFSQQAITLLTTGDHLNE